MCIIHSIFNIHYFDMDKKTPKVFIVRRDGSCSAEDIQTNKRKHDSKHGDDDSTIKQKHCQKIRHMNAPRALEEMKKMTISMKDCHELYHNARRQMEHARFVEQISIRPEIRDFYALLVQYKIPNNYAVDCVESGESFYYNIYYNPTGYTYRYKFKEHYQFTQQQIDDLNKITNTTAFKKLQNAHDADKLWFMPHNPGQYGDYDYMCLRTEGLKSLYYKNVLHGQNREVLHHGDKL
jgi:hypothetical protein